jgi:hypothetical protein
LVATGTKPLLLVDIDGVISLFRTPLPGGGNTPVEGSFHSIEGIPHFLSSTAAGHLLDLAAVYDLVWCSGWEERADEHLPHLLGVPAGLPHLSFDRDVGGRSAHGLAHWKLAAIDTYAGDRPLAWIDDAHDAACAAWAADRPGPTLLVATDPAIGITKRHVDELLEWAELLEGAVTPRP